MMPYWHARRVRAGLRARSLTVLASALGLAVIAAGLVLLVLATPDAASRRDGSRADGSTIATSAHSVGRAHVPCSMHVGSNDTRTAHADDGASGMTDETVRADQLGTSSSVTLTYYSSSGSAPTRLGSWHADHGALTAPIRVPVRVLAGVTSSGWLHAVSASTDCWAVTPGGRRVDATPSYAADNYAADDHAARSAYPPVIGPPSRPSSVTATGAPSSTRSSPARTTGATTTTPPPTGSASSTPPVQPSSARPTSPSQASVGNQQWGLPTSFIVTMIVILLLVGGLAVLFLTRRSS